MANERPAWMSAGSLWQSALDAVPLLIFVVDEDMRMMAFNPASTSMVGHLPDTVFRRRGGEVLNCVHHTDSAEGCGHGPTCGECVLRNSVMAAVQGQRITRQRTVMELVRETSVRAVELLVTAAPFDHDGQRLALLVLEDITELSTLRRLLPICASCKKIRNDDNYWQSVERFFSSNLNVNFSHGLCPDCARTLYPEINDPPSDGKK